MDSMSRPFAVERAAAERALERAIRGGSAGASSSLGSPAASKSPDTSRPIGVFAGANHLLNLKFDGMASGGDRGPADSPQLPGGSPTGRLKQGVKQALAYPGKSVSPGKPIRRLWPAGEESPIKGSPPARSPNGKSGRSPRGAASRGATPPRKQMARESLPRPGSAPPRADKTPGSGRRKSYGVAVGDESHARRASPGTSESHSFRSRPSSRDRISLSQSPLLGGDVRSALVSIDSQPATSDRDRALDDMASDGFLFSQSESDNKSTPRLSPAGARSERDELSFFLSQEYDKNGGLRVSDLSLPDDDITDRVMRSVIHDGSHEVAGNGYSEASGSKEPSIAKLSQSYEQTLGIASDEHHRPIPAPLAESLAEVLEGKTRNEIQQLLSVVKEQIQTMFQAKESEKQRLEFKNKGLEETIRMIENVSEHQAVSNAGEIRDAIKTIEADVQRKEAEYKAERESRDAEFARLESELRETKTENRRLSIFSREASSELEWWQSQAADKESEVSTLSAALRAERELTRRQGLSNAALTERLNSLEQLLQKKTESMGILLDGNHALRGRLDEMKKKIEHYQVIDRDESGAQAGEALLALQRVHRVLVDRCRFRARACMVASVLLGFGWVDRWRLHVITVTRGMTKVSRGAFMTEYKNACSRDLSIRSRAQGDNARLNDTELVLNYAVATWRVHTRVASVVRSVWATLGRRRVLVSFREWSRKSVRRMRVVAEVVGRPAEQVEPGRAEVPEIRGLSPGNLLSIHYEKQLQKVNNLFDESPEQMKSLHRALFEAGPSDVVKSKSVGVGEGGEKALAKPLTRPASLRTLPLAREGHRVPTPELVSLSANASRRTSPSALDLGNGRLTQVSRRHENASKELKKTSSFVKNENQFDKTKFLFVKRGKKEGGLLIPPEEEKIQEKTVFNSETLFSSPTPGGKMPLSPKELDDRVHERHEEGLLKRRPTLRMLSIDDAEQPKISLGDVDSDDEAAETVVFNSQSDYPPKTARRVTPRRSNPPDEPAVDLASQPDPGRPESQSRLGPAAWAAAGAAGTALVGAMSMWMSQ